MQIEGGYFPVEDQQFTKSLTIKINLFIEILQKYEMDHLNAVHNTDPSSLHLTYHGVRKHLDLVSKHSLEVVKFHKNLSMILEDFKKEMDVVSVNF